MRRLDALFVDVVLFNRAARTHLSRTKRHEKRIFTTKLTNPRLHIVITLGFIASHRITSQYPISTLHLIAYYLPPSPGSLVCPTPRARRWRVPQPRPATRLPRAISSSPKVRDCIHLTCDTTQKRYGCIVFFPDAFPALAPQPGRGGGYRKHRCEAANNPAERIYFLVKEYCVPDLWPPCCQFH